MIESIIVSISAQSSPGQCLWLQQKADDKSVKQIVHVSFLTDKNMNPKSGKVCNSWHFYKNCESKRFMIHAIQAFRLLPIMVCV